jgi:hypothetical protein
MGTGDQLRFRCPDFPHLQLAANTNAVILNCSEIPNDWFSLMRNHNDVSRPQESMAEAPKRIRVVVRAATSDDWIGVAYQKDYTGDPSAIHEYAHVDSDAVDPTTLCTPVQCGTQPVLPAERVGCGKYILSELELYRCADCTVPFHRECLRNHFGRPDAH